SRRFRIEGDHTDGSKVSLIAKAKAVTSPTPSPHSKTLARCSWAPRSHSNHHRVFASGVLAGGRGWASHSFTVRSALVDANRFPSGLNATLTTQPLCPFNVSIS